MTSLTDVVIEDPRWQDVDLETLAENACAQTLLHLGLSTTGYEIAILACDDVHIADLNAEFRDKPTPTNVLSWPAHDLAPDQSGAIPHSPPEPDALMGESLGDIAISYDTCQREAQEMGKQFKDHVTHLIVHGLLHLLGYDHVSDSDATLMEQLEIETLGKMGVSNPY
jgi:probable rRNA maturation factor